TQVPYAFEINDHLRIFFGARKEHDKTASVYYINIDRSEPQRILEIKNEPVLEKGATGAFDQDGVLPVCLKRVGTDIYMYYGGFTKHVSGSHNCMMGLAISKDNGDSFTKIGDGPILPISKTDPYLIGSADIVLKDNEWHMIYTSGTKWSEINSSLEISYTLKYAYSTDGINWIPTGKIVIPHESPVDAYAKPSIFKKGNLYYMYFSKRQIVDYRIKGEAAYSLGMATSMDLINWERHDDIRGIETSSAGWDSEMICYPNIIETDSRYLMFYNGNGFGKTGFGLAELIK
ncbi:MAG: hypothetical protein ABJC98_13445, partial [Bacteroidota bacterium]